MQNLGVFLSQNLYIRTSLSLSLSLFGREAIILYGRFRESKRAKSRVNDGSEPPRIELLLVRMLHTMLYGSILES